MTAGHDHAPTGARDRRPLAIVLGISVTILLLTRISSGNLNTRAAPLEVVKVLTAHVVVEDSCLHDGSRPLLLDRLQECLAGHFDVEHSTFQFEPAVHAEHEPAVHA